MKWLSNIDLNKNQLLNAVIQNLASAPGTPVQGQVYFNTTDKKMYLYNNTAWIDLSELNLSGAEIVTLINASASLIDDNNLSSAANDAITKRHSQNTDTGTSSATFTVGTSGVKIKNNSGHLQVRNNADSANANIEVANTTVTGTLDVQGNTALGNGGSDTVVAHTALTTIKSAGLKDDADAATRNVFEVVDSTATPNKLFEVRQNGDTIIAGVLTVNGTGTSTFAGDVSINGALNVAQGTTAQADMSGQDLTLTGNLVVNGNTTLGNDAGDTLNVTGVVTLPTTTTIGGVTQANISDAVTKRHSQGTDTGTTSATFQLQSGSSGVKIKNSSGVLEVRNSADNAYANIRVNDLIVEGTTTTINSNTVNIGDSEIELNSDVTTSASNSNGGVAIKRLKADNTTRADAKIVFNNSTGRWETVMGAVAATVTAVVANKIVFAVGNGVATSVALTHNLGTQDVVVMVRETTGGAVVMPDITCTDVNTVTLTFAVAPTSNQYTATVIG